MQNKKIPIVFAFDDNYALPASIAIKSLIDSKNPDTQYDVFVMHSGLQKSTMRKMEKICPINWLHVDASLLRDAPTTENWTLAIYYRLLIADMIPRYDKIIWSDVDVLFRGDLTAAYEASMNGADWAGVAAERADETNGIHAHFSENTKPYIHMSGFMVIDAKKWRAENKLKDFFEVIKKFGPRLKFFDLDILNLAAGKIAPLPFEYCVLENIYDADDIREAPEYPWLARVHSHSKLMHAKENPIIIHYAGKWPKIWLRKYEEIPKYYWHEMKKSAFCDTESYKPGWRTAAQRALLWIPIKICPVKPWRHKMRQICNKKPQGH